MVDAASRIYSDTFQESFSQTGHGKGEKVKSIGSGMVQWFWSKDSNCI